MEKFQNGIKYLIKSALVHNPIDAFARWNEKRLRKKGKWDKFCTNVYWRFGYRFFPKILWWTNKLTYEGEENIPRKKTNTFKDSFVVVSNHNHMFDPFLLGVGIKYRKTNWVAKPSLMEMPIMKSFIRLFGTIPMIFRGEKRVLSEESKEKILKTLKVGDAVGMFPEGNRAKIGTLQEFHAGAARICLENKVPFYLPVCLTGSQGFFKGKIHIRVGKPVYLDYSGLEFNYETAKEISEDMREQVKCLLNGSDNQPQCRYEKKK